MSIAPPTPPPTGATELMDQEKEATVAVQAAIPAAPVTETAPPASGSTANTANADRYRVELQALADLIPHNISEVIRVAELADLNREGDDRPSRLCVTAPLVLAYLIQDELPPARFAFTRLPQTVASEPLARALFALYTSVSERNYETIYVNAEKVVGIVRTPDSIGTDLAAVVSALMSTFIDTFRQRTLALINRAYTSIGLPVAQGYFGLGAEQTLSALQTAGWTADGSTSVLTAPTSSPTKTMRINYGSSSLFNLDLVSTATAKTEA